MTFFAALNSYSRQRWAPRKRGSARRGSHSCSFSSVCGIPALGEWQTSCFDYCPSLHSECSDGQNWSSSLALMLTKRLWRCAHAAVAASLHALAIRHRPRIPTPNALERRELKLVKKRHFDFHQYPVILFGITDRSGFLRFFNLDDKS